MKITILHPDLGIGGAERLILDVAQALRISEHNVKIVTNYYSFNHCFSDLLTFDEIKKINFFPRSFFGKFSALCAYIRICIAAIYICLKQNDADIIICDQISAPLFIFRLFLKAKLIFYCHYPDQLLTKRESILKIVYRFFLDKFECLTTGLADLILVNSKYTESIFRKTFPSLFFKSVNILYPSLNTEYFDKLLNSITKDDKEIFLAILKNNLKKGIKTNLNFDENFLKFKYVFLSLNRFEKKKNIELAIKSFDKLKNNILKSTFEKCALIIAGGYDTCNYENIQYYKYLENLVKELDLNSVFFVLSPDDSMKLWLYKRSFLTIYTPLNEHFGIIPIESMYLMRPVLATNSGGPLETIVDGKTGFLTNNDPSSFCHYMSMAIKKEHQINKMGIDCHNHVINNFSFSLFVKELNEFIINLYNN